jgi:Uma2 family endonuclease
MIENEAIFAGGLQKLRCYCMVAMSAILDLPEAHERVMRWSVKDYERFTEMGAFRKNVEMIRGIALNKAPEPPEQTYLAHLLFDMLRAVLPCGFLALRKSPLRLRDSEPEPDVAVVRGQKSDYRDVHPSTAALVIEVAISNVSLDRENASLYAEAGVDEYWIVLPKQRQVEVYREPRDGAYAVKLVCEAPAMLECAGVPGVRVNLGELFAKI